MDAKVATVANGLGIAQLRTQLFAELSSGEKTKIALVQGTKTRAAICAI